jgi:hypothetical protein
LGTAAPLYAPILQNARAKWDIVRKSKREEFPYGTDIMGWDFQNSLSILSTDINKLIGVLHMMEEDRKKLPINSRYIHKKSDSDTGGTSILSAVPFLLSRIHAALNMQVDTTFKRVAGNFNEWELVIWDSEVHRGVIFWFSFRSIAYETF